MRFLNPPPLLLSHARVRSFTLKLHQVPPPFPLPSPIPLHRHPACQAELHGWFRVALQTSSHRETPSSRARPSPSLLSLTFIHGCPHGRGVCVCVCVSNYPHSERNTSIRSSTKLSHTFSPYLPTPSHPFHLPLFTQNSSKPLEDPPPNHCFCHCLFC